MFLASSSVQHYLGEGYAVNNMFFKFLRKAELGDVLTAQTNCIKRGMHTAVTETQIYRDETLAAVMYADAYKIGETLPFSVDYFPTDERRPYSDLAINSRKDPHLGDDIDAFRHMFCLSSKYNTDLLKHVGEYGSVELYTDEEFAGNDGNVEPAILGALVDSISGLIWWENADAAVTTNISMSVFATIEPGASITCSSEASLRSGALYSSRGLFWADNTCIGSYTATFMEEQLPVVQ